MNEDKNFSHINFPSFIENGMFDDKYEEHISEFLIYSKPDKNLEKVMMNYSCNEKIFFEEWSVENYVYTGTGGFIDLDNFDSNNKDYWANYYNDYDAEGDEENFSCCCGNH